MHNDNNFLKIIIILKRNNLIYIYFFFIKNRFISIKIIIIICKLFSIWVDNFLFMFKDLVKFYYKLILVFEKTFK